MIGPYFSWLPWGLGIGPLGFRSVTNCVLGSLNRDLRATTKKGMVRESVHTPAEQPSLGETLLIFLQSTNLRLSELRTQTFCPSTSTDQHQLSGASSQSSTLSCMGSRRLRLVFLEAACTRS